MQCNAPCLYRVCEAGSNGSWCGRVRESCSALWQSSAIQVGVASHGTKAADNKKVLASLSVSVCVVLITPFKASASKSDGVRKKHHGSDESTTTLGPNCSGFVSAFVQWTDLLQINKSTCRNVWFLILFSFSFFVFFAVLVTTMMLSGML